MNCFNDVIINFLLLTNLLWFCCLNFLHCYIISKIAT